MAVSWDYDLLCITAVRLAWHTSVHRVPVILSILQTKKNRNKIEKNTQVSTMYIAEMKYNNTGFTFAPSFNHSVTASAFLDPSVYKYSVRVSDLFRSVYSLTLHSSVIVSAIVFTPANNSLSRRVTFYCWCLGQVRKSCHFLKQTIYFCFIPFSKKGK